ncbi:flavodoxin family protein [Clostridium aminobutyricum]|uniref:NAD(P)H-dependent oxidoreductase n=1 Tax=Clostridium aminobutyricum TaxID=33953 RepID=A0A939DAF6_CLOAM|nr:flavodoxin [Clostridium aminobutyricum]MBN7774379.1 NAD(P)H-dependent oxidoreductase [Clostridium aminobutyricum]
MKSIIVYYSLEGNCKLIAEAVAQEIGAETLELKPKKDIPTSGPLKYLLGGRSAIRKEQPELTNTDLGIVNNYDLIIVGTPVWAATFAPAIRSFSDAVHLQDKKMAFFACSGGGPTTKCIEHMKTVFNGNSFLSDISFTNPLKNPMDCTNKAKAWAKSLL